MSYIEMDTKPPEYPTDQQMGAFWDAYQRAGKQGIVEFLSKQDRDHDHEAAQKKVDADQK
jgi:hypothetical protein